MSNEKIKPMLSNISWQQYWIFLSVLIVLYYLFVYLLYFKAPLTVNFLNRRKHHFTTDDAARKTEPAMPFLFDEPLVPANTDGTSEEHIVYACMDELNAFFDNQKKSKPVKDDLVVSLYTILQKYPSLKKSEYKDSITNVIATQCENICSIHLSAEELKRVWFGW